MKYIALLITMAFVASCSTMPIITSPMLSAAQKDFACPSPFLKEKYQLIHAIEINAAGNAQGAIIGVTVVDPFTRFVSCAIMTAEGMVLLEAESFGEKLTVHRALPPFDSGDFAQNLIDDIRLIYFNPQGLLQKKGNLSDGSTVCRWQEESGNLIDVISGKPESTEINKYSACGNLKRHIKLTQQAGKPYSIIELQGSEMLDYTLLMTLIEAQPADGNLPEKKLR
jgi:hypothetical protein